MPASVLVALLVRMAGSARGRLVEHSGSIVRDVVSTGSQCGAAGRRTWIKRNDGTTGRITGSAEGGAAHPLFTVRCGRGPHPLILSRRYHFSVSGWRGCLQLMRDSDDLWD